MSRNHRSKGLELLREEAITQSAPGNRMTSARFPMERLYRPNKKPKIDVQFSNSSRSEDKPPILNPEYRVTIQSIKSLIQKKLMLNKIKGSLLCIAKNGVKTNYNFIRSKSSRRKQININVYSQFQWATPICNRNLQKSITHKCITPKEYVDTPTPKKRAHAIPYNIADFARHLCKSPIVSIEHCDFNEYSKSRRITEINALKLYGGFANKGPSPNKRRIDLRTVFGREHLSTNIEIF